MAAPNGALRSAPKKPTRALRSAGCPDAEKGHDRAEPPGSVMNSRRVMSSMMRSFDHLVGAGEQGRSHRKAERLGSLEIDRQLEFRRLFNRQLGSLCSIENLDDERRRAPAQIRDIRTVRD